MRKSQFVVKLMKYHTVKKPDYKDYLANSLVSWAVTPEGAAQPCGPIWRGSHCSMAASVESADRPLGWAESFKGWFYSAQTVKLHHHMTHWGPKTLSP